MSEILFLTHRVPYPPDRGDKIRSWHILQRIARGAPVHVCALCDDEHDLAHRGVLEAVAASVSIVPVTRSRRQAIISALANGGSASVAACASPELQRRVDDLLATQPIATIFAFSGQMAQFVPQGCDARFVMDFVDMDSAKFEGFGGFANREEARRLFAWEKATAERADLSLFVSRAEADLFRAKSGATRVDVLENGIDLDHYDPAGDYAPVSIGSPLIVFTGQMDYRPNIEAVTGFAREAMPQIRSGVRDASFAIVGRGAPAEVVALDALPGVMVTGEVADTRDWLAAADVIVAPLLLARGIQNKVLEAMAMAKPVVASPAAAEGIDAIAGEALIVAEGPAAQAEAVKVLLRDKALAARIGAAGRARLEARYGWDARLARLPEILALPT